MDPDTVLLTRSLGSAGADAEGSGRSGLASEALQAVVGALTHASPRFVATAPGRLNILGGIADYSGGLVLNTPLAEHVCVGVQCQPSECLTITRGRPEASDGRVPLEIPLADMHRACHATSGSPERRRLAEATSCPTARCVVGTLVELAAAGLIGQYGGGFAVAVGSTLADLSEAGHDAAVAASVAVAVLESRGARPERGKIAAVCQRVENDWLHRPVGMADAVCALMGEPGVLTPLESDSGTLATGIPIPPHVGLLGVDCGVLQTDADEKYARVRTATFMGRVLVERIIKHAGHSGRPWDGHLAHLSVADYVNTVRDRIPTKMKGSEFLSHFGESGDPLTRIDPNTVYKIRSRTEHHVYEQCRARELKEGLSRGSCEGDSAGLIAAGEAMYASHWSYGQRCGLGSVETDALVTTMRKLGAAAGIWGAKTSGRGCGGTVAVLMRKDDGTREALGEVLRKYEARTGHATRVLDGSSPGALVLGVRRY